MLVDQTRYPTEHWRIQFYIDRDGLESAIDSIATGMRTYRKAVLTRRPPKPHFASLPHYRPLFIRSYLDFKRFVLDCRK